MIEKYVVVVVNEYKLRVEWEKNQEEDHHYSNRNIDLHIDLQGISSSHER